MGYNRRFIYSSVAKIEVCAVFHSRAMRKVYKALCGDAMLVPFQGAPRWKSWSWADRTLRTMTIHATWLVQLVRSVEVGFKKLLSFFNLFQYYSDSNDAESWMKEKMYVVSSEDYGRDEQSAMVGEKNLSDHVLWKVITHKRMKWAINKSNFEHSFVSLWWPRG